MQLTGNIRSLGLVLTVAAIVTAGCAGASTESNMMSPNPATGAQGAQPSIPPGTPPANAPVSTSSTSHPNDPLAGVHSWSCLAPPQPGVPQSVQQLAENGSDLVVVVDNSCLLPDNVRSTLNTIRGRTHKMVLARMNVARVPPDSPLWNPAWLAAPAGTAVPALSPSAPAWLEPVAAGTPPAAYSVRYWDADWQARVRAEIDRLRKAGLDGVVLDGCDRYADEAGARPAAAADMASLVEAISRAVHGRHSRFPVVVVDNQGFVDALADKPRAEYLSRVDGVLSENVFYAGDLPEDNDLNTQASRIGALDRYEMAGKRVFVADYLTRPDKVFDFDTRARTQGFLPFTACAGVVTVHPANASTATGGASAIPTTSAGTGRS
ncbi:MAG: endo alpha-1,4 polygalactosaminidase [Capsulimonadaceae bacterium]